MNNSRYRTNHAGLPARMDVLSNGNVILVGTGGGSVGIGTETPDTGAKVDIYGMVRGIAYPSTGTYPTTGKGLEIYYDSGGDYGVIESIERDEPYNRRTLLISGNPLIVNPTGGYVGIGLMTPVCPLHIRRGDGCPPVVDFNSVVQLDSDSNATNFWFNVPSSGTNATFGFATDGAFRHALTYNVVGNWICLTNQGEMGTPTQGLFVNSVGNVGIGLPNPNAKLVIFNSNETADAPILRFIGREDWDTQSLIYFKMGGNATYWEVNSGGNGGALIVEDEAREIVRFVNTGVVVNESGRAGIDFRVESDTNANALFVNSTTGNVGIETSTPATKLAVVGLAPSASGNYMRYRTDGTGRIYYAASSKKYKDNIQPLKDDFQKILKATPKSFIDKATGDKCIGYIAEEFEELGLKNLIGYKDDKPDYINYELISLYLVEVVKKQEQRIRRLERMFRIPEVI